MHSLLSKHCVRGVGWAVALSGLGLFAAPVADAAPLQTKAGDVGSIHVDLHRGAMTPFEATVLATPNGCRSHLDLDLTWDEGKGSVRVRLRGKQALAPQPDVSRTLGQDFRPNANFPEPEDIVDGSYQLWIIGAAGPVMTFHYDPNTFALLGGGPGFVAPPGTLTLESPTLYTFGSPKFQPSKSGAVNLDWTFDYDDPHRGDRPEYSYHALAFVPSNLCEYDPFRIDQTTLRTWISAPLAREHARPWSDYVRGGLMFEVTVEPSDYAGVPYKTQISTYSGATVVAGGVPPNWTLDLEAALTGLAPPIRPWPQAGQCAQEFVGFHTGPNTCTPG